MKERMMVGRSHLFRLLAPGIAVAALVHVAHAQSVRGPESAAEYATDAEVQALIEALQNDPLLEKMAALQDLANGRSPLDAETLDVFLQMAGYDLANLRGGWRELRTPGTATGDVQVTLAERPGSLTIVTNVGVLQGSADGARLQRAIENGNLPGTGQILSNEQRAILVHRVALRGLTLARFERDVAAGRARASALRRMFDLAGNAP